MGDPRSIETLLAELFVTEGYSGPGARELAGRVMDAIATERCAAIRLDPEAVLALKSLRWRLVEAITEDATYVPVERDLEAIEGVLRIIGGEQP